MRDGRARCDSSDADDNGAPKSKSSKLSKGPADLILMFQMFQKLFLYLESSDRKCKFLTIPSRPSSVLGGTKVQD